MMARQANSDSCTTSSLGIEQRFVRTDRSQSVTKILAVADHDLAAAGTPGLHNDWSFNIAYNHLHLATAALAVGGE